MTIWPLSTTKRFLIRPFMRENAFAWIEVIYQILWLENVLWAIVLQTHHNHILLGIICAITKVKTVWASVYANCIDKKIDKQLDLQLIHCNCFFLFKCTHFDLNHLIYTMQGKRTNEKKEKKKREKRTGCARWNQSVPFGKSQSSMFFI